MSEGKMLGAEDLEECLRKVGSGTTTEETEVALRGHIAALDADLVRAGNELDAAQLQSKYAWERQAEKDRAYGEALKERDEWKGKALACADERDEAVALAERRRQDRADALRVTTTEGLSASEWVARAWKAERERDAALVHVSRLEEVVRLANAEFTRLKPSGQVAEDVAVLKVLMDRLDERIMEGHATGVYVRAKKDVVDGRDTLSRLAAMAQGYEAAVAEAGTLRAHCEHHDARLTETRNALRDAGVPDTKGTVPNHSALTVAQRIGLLAQERDIAEADNAALLKRAVHETKCAVCDWDDAPCDCVLSQPHPGAALLERLSKAEATVRDVGERLVQAGGTRDGTVLEQLNALLERHRQEVEPPETTERTAL